MPQDPVARPPFVRVADLAEIRPGTSKLVVGPFDKPMALFNVAGEIFAINAVCPHRGGPLAAGARVRGFGWGEGRASVSCARGGGDVTGVDVSAAGLHRGGRLARAPGVKVRWRRGAAAHDVPAGPFDLVYSCGAIHYIP